MATKLTKAELEYRKELKRLQQFIRRANKRGIYFEQSPIPPRPKRVTQATVRKLQRLTPETLYKKAAIQVDVTGELITTASPKIIKQVGRITTEPLRTPKTGVPIKEQEIIEGAETPPTREYADFTHIVLSNFLETLKQFPNAAGRETLLQWYDKLIDDNGREAVADMLQKGAENGLILTWEVAYKSDYTKNYITEMMNYLPDQGDIYIDQIMEVIEQGEWWESPS